MFNPLNWPLRKYQPPVTPNGPNYAKAKKFTIDISGTQLSLKLNKPTGKLFSNYYPCLSIDINKLNGFKPEPELPDLLFKHILVFHWAFNGPAFTGCLADLGCYINLFKIDNAPRNFSAFNPADFEALIEKNIRHSKGNREEIIHGRSLWVAPVNWCELKHLGVPAISYEIQSRADAGKERCRFILVPIADDRYIEFAFDYRPQILGSLAEVERKISPENMSRYVENIISSIRVTLSPDMHHRRMAVLESCARTHFTPEVAPYKFTTKQDDEDWQVHQELIANNPFAPLNR